MLHIIISKEKDVINNKEHIYVIVKLIDHEIKILETE